MKSPAIKFLISVVLLTIICAGLQVLWNSRMPENMKLENGFLLLGIFAGAVTAIHLFLLRASKSSPSGFIRNYMASTVIKFFIYLTVLIAFLLYTPGNKQALVIHFLFYYAAFTALEVGMLYSELGRKKNEQMSK